MATATDGAVSGGGLSGAPMLPRVFRVLRNQRETYNTFTLTLAPPAGEGAFRFEPGQFNMLYTPGVGEVPISISGAPGATREIVHTIRSVGPVTRALEALKRGDGVGLRGPYGTAWPMRAAEGRDLVFIAGGIGLAPLRPAILHALRNRDKYGHVSLLFGAREPRDILFMREVETWRGRLDADVEVTVDRADAAWHGQVGVVTRLIPRATFDPERTTAFVCGPEIMMVYSVRELARAGVAAASIQVSLERNMKCAIGLCGHCQMGPLFVCKDGPVFPWDRVEPLLAVREI